MNVIITDLIKHDVARRSELFTEQTSFLVMQEMVAAEIHKAHTQLRRDLHADRQLEAESFFERLKKYLDRLAGLMVAAVRSSGIARRLAYASLSKNYGSSYAKAIYEDAREKVSQELLLKQIPPEHPIHDVSAS
jgi:hypothetical protein